MLQVNIEKIIPVTEARDMFNKIVDEVEGTDELYVLTKNGKPAAVVVGVNHLEKLTGESNISVTAAPSDTSDNLNGDASSDNQATSDDNSSEESESVFASADDVFADNNTNDDSFAPTTPEPVELSEPTPMPTTENLGDVTEPTLPPAPQGTDQIKPIPEDFSDNIPTTPIPEDLAGATESSSPDQNNSQPFDTGSEDPSNASSSDNSDPFSSSSTIAEMNEEDVFGSQPSDNSNNPTPQQPQQY